MPLKPIKATTVNQKTVIRAGSSSSKCHGQERATRFPDAAAGRESGIVNGLDRQRESRSSRISPGNSNAYAMAKAIANAASMTQKICKTKHFIPLTLGCVVAVRMLWREAQALGNTGWLELISKQQSNKFNGYSLFRDRVHTVVRSHTGAIARRDFVRSRPPLASR